MWSEGLVRLKPGAIARLPPRTSVSAGGCLLRVPLALLISSFPLRGGFLPLLPVVADTPDPVMVLNPGLMG